MAHSFDSAPEFVKKIWPGWPGRLEQQVVDLDGRRGGLGLAKKLLTCRSVELAADRLGDHRVGVAERHDGDPGEEVEVALAVGVPELGAAPALELIAGGPNTGMKGQCAIGAWSKCVGSSCRRCPLVGA